MKAFKLILRVAEYLLADPAGQELLKQLFDWLIEIFR